MTHIFVIALDDGRLASPHLRSWLAHEEQERAQRFGTAQLVQRFVATRLAVRIRLGRIVGRHPSELVFASNPWGRPELPGGPHFNVTHVDGLALLAVDQDAIVGIDAEAVTEVIDDATMAEFLSPEEAASRQSERSCSATQLWVRKEALLKAHGRGLSTDPKTLTVGWHVVDTENWRSVSVGEGCETYSLIDIDAGRAVVAALARSGSDRGDVSIVPLEYW